ncbi:MAG TPA: DUF1905 domain-containing protein [Actinobacteria bacterium]|nr:DUF1905 domain-containing protein [Actinomycetota bacterium]
MDQFEVTGEVELFPQTGGWHYVLIPAWISDELSHFADRGLIPIRAKVGSTRWDTSLLPKGDGRHFVALNAKVRKANDIDIEDQVTVQFEVRSHR